MIDRAGLAVRDGATHHGIFDVAFLSHIPGVTIVSPATYSALREAAKFALETEGVVAVRYPNKAESVAVVNAFYKNESEELSLKTNFSKEESPEKVYVTYGSIAENVLKAAELLRKEGERVGVILLELLKPYDKSAEKAMPYLCSAKKIVFVEEGIRNGGAGMLFGDALASQGLEISHRNYDVLAIDDNFASPDVPCELYDYVGLSPEKIAERMK